MASEGWAVERLRACALFAQARPDVLAEVASALRRRRFRRNEVIFHQGDPGDSLHFSGQVPHYWTNETDVPARAIWMALRNG